VAAASWALAPIPVTLPPDVHAPTKTVSPAAATTTARLDRAAFDVVLWSPTPPTSTTGTVSAAKPATLDLQIDLIGITDEDGRRFAALYHRGSDKLFLVHDGEEVLGAKVTSLTLDQIVLKRGGHEVALARKRDGR
jgi:type II secretory pathway component PulC